MSEQKYKVGDRFYDKDDGDTGTITGAEKSDGEWEYRIEWARNGENYLETAECLEDESYTYMGNLAPTPAPPPSVGKQCGWCREIIRDGDNHTNAACTPEPAGENVKSLDLDKARAVYREVVKGMVEEASASVAEEASRVPINLYGGKVQYEKLSVPLGKVGPHMRDGMPKSDTKVSRSTAAEPDIFHRVSRLISCDPDPMCCGVCRQESIRVRRERIKDWPVRYTL